MYLKTAALMYQQRLGALSSSSMACTPCSCFTLQLHFVRSLAHTGTQRMQRPKQASL